MKSPVYLDLHKAKLRAEHDSFLFPRQENRFNELIQCFIVTG